MNCKQDILLLDNFDSFTYNIVEQLRCKKNHVVIYRNTVPLKVILLSLSRLKNPIIVLSPGPGEPKYAGCMLELLSYVIGKIPVIGICLGHQAIVEFYGGVLERAGKILHGKSSLMYHDQRYMFKSLPNPLLVSRYHSLICTNIPPGLRINAFLNNTVMGVLNNTQKVCGFQFHPESILTTYGAKLLENTIFWARM